MTITSLLPQNIKFGCKFQNFKGDLKELSQENKKSALTVCQVYVHDLVKVH